MNSVRKTILAFVLSLVILLTGGGFSLGQYVCLKSKTSGVMLGESMPCCSETQKENIDCCGEEINPCSDTKSSSLPAFKELCCELTQLQTPLNTFTVAFTPLVVKGAPVVMMMSEPEQHLVRVELSSKAIDLVAPHPPPRTTSAHLADLQTFRI